MKNKFYVVIAYVLCPIRVLSVALNIVSDYYENGADPAYISSQLITLLLFLGAMIGLMKFSKAGKTLLYLACIYQCFYFLGFIPGDYAAGDYAEVATDLISCGAYLAICLYSVSYFKKRRFLFEAAYVPEEENGQENFDIPKENDGKVLFKGILLSLVLVLVIGVGNSLVGSIRDCLYSIFINIGKPTALQMKNYARIAESMALFCEVGFGVWAAFVFNKMQIVTYEQQFLTGKVAKLTKLFLAGIVIGILVDLAAGGLLVANGAVLNYNGTTATYLMYILLGIPAYLGVGVFEEIVSRGILEGYFEAKGKRIAGIVISVIFFVAIHFVTGAYNEVSAAVFLAAAAVVYSAILIYTKNLWIGIGIHFAYDWAVTYLIGMRVLKSRECFFSLLGVITTRNRTIALVIVYAVMLAVMLYLFNKRKKESEV